MTFYKIINPITSQIEMYPDLSLAFNKLIEYNGISGKNEGFSIIDIPCVPCVYWYNIDDKEWYI